MKLSDLRRKAVSGIEPDRNQGTLRITTVDGKTIEGPIKGKRIDIVICDDLTEDISDLSREEVRDILTWYGNDAKKVSTYTKKR